MESINREQAYRHLIEISEQKGYVLFDDIMNSADRWSLSIEDVDWLANIITTRGVLVYDTVPSTEQTTDEEYDDYAQVDYDAIFNRVVELDPSLKDFISSIKNIKPPQAREMDQLKYQVIEGNLYARRRVIEMHLRIAVRIALQRVEEYDCDMADTIQDACIGLINAVDKYDPDLNGPFGSYASLWIYQNITRSQANQRASIYYPAHRKEDYFTVYPFLKSLGYTSSELLGSKKVLDIVQEKLDCDVKQAQDAIYQCVPLESIDEVYKASMKCIDDPGQMYCDNENLYINDFSDGIIDECFRGEISQILFEKLKPRDKAVIKARYGFDDGKAKTLEEVGSALGVTRERVRQIESRALKKMKSACARQGVEYL